MLGITTLRPLPLRLLRAGARVGGVVGRRCYCVQSAISRSRSSIAFV